MKGLIAVLFFLLTLTSYASEGIQARNLSAIKLTSGEIISHLSLQESTNVLKSLKIEEKIEIRNRIIYFDEVSQLIVSKLTKVKLAEKKPNPQDYN